ncbi:hypothetical protein CYL21_2519 [Plasmodium falciparum NF54]|uniref:Uncharacterized protein n=2 Tax=Plasmodium falciparum TaxID=5833 RepID=Q8ILS9_PLAF7|nr:conserved Plasmodium protein, unknown function [Plasmodium falciparum 3D7]KAF4329342.1 hypothetical protein CYL21_2519 [Plasmodium falciparum NF54]PKC49803.1 hypothetical protein CK202_0536 [Plasmodium falciparum NF54]CZT99877.1 conserved Plasmodium protein, unknown function [Plasmodium falciparum 3D7]|eukprot:XP_001348338.1 conserved Plasmodium protein, unknown function [Plasmodium falciparum 3D7]
MEKSSKLYLLQEYMKEYNRATTVPHDSKNKDNDKYLSLYNDINNEDQYILNPAIIEYKNINEMKNSVDMNNYLSTKNLLNETSKFDDNKEEIYLRNGSLDMEHIKYGNIQDINIQDVDIEDGYIKDLYISNEQFENKSYPNDISRKVLIKESKKDITQDYNLKDIKETEKNRTMNKSSSYKQYNMNNCTRKNSSFNYNVTDNICHGNEKYKMSDNKQICEIIKKKEQLIIDEICTMVKNANKKIKNQVEEYKNKNVSVINRKDNTIQNSDINNTQNILHRNEDIEEYKLNENDIHNTVKITKEVYSSNSFSSNSDTTLSYESVNNKKNKEEIRNHSNNVEGLRDLTKEGTLIYKSEKEYTKNDIIKNMNYLNMECKLNPLNNNDDTSDINTNNNSKYLYPENNSHKLDIFNNSMHIRNIINNNNLEDFKNIDTLNNPRIFNYKKNVNKNGINHTKNDVCNNIQTIHLSNIEETQCDESFMDIVEKRKNTYDLSDTYKKDQIKDKELQIGCFLKEENNNNKTDILKNPLKEEIRHLKLKSKNSIVKEQTCINDISNQIEEHFYSTYISKDALIGAPTNDEKYNNNNNNYYYYNIPKNLERTKETIETCNKYCNEDIQERHINKSLDENNKQSLSAKEQINKENIPMPYKNEQLISNIKNIEIPHCEENSIDEKKYFNVNEKDFFENFKEHIENDYFDYSIMEENRKCNIDTNFYYDNKFIDKNKIVTHEFGSDKEKYIEQNEPSIYNKSSNIIKNNDYNEKVKYMMSSINASCKSLKRTSLYNEKKNEKIEPSLLLNLTETNTLENKLNDSFESQVVEKVGKDVKLENKVSSNYKQNKNNSNDNNNNNNHNNKKKKYANICTNIYNNYDQKGYKENINIKLTSLNHKKRSNTPSIMIADVLKIIDKNSEENYKERKKFVSPYNNKNTDDENNCSYNNIKFGNIKNEKSNKIGYPKNSNRKVVNIKSHYISKYNNMFLYMDTDKNKKKNEENKTYKKINVPCHKKIYECEKRDHSKEIIKSNCKKDDKKKQCSFNGNNKKEKLFEQKLPNFGGQEIPIWGGIEVPNWEEEYKPLGEKIREPYVEEKKEERIRNKIFNVNSNMNKIHYPSPNKLKKMNSIHNTQETEKLRKLKNNNGNKCTYEKGEEKNKNFCSQSRNNSLTSFRNKNDKNIKKNVLTKKDSILNQDKINDCKDDIKKMEKKKIYMNSQMNQKKIESDKKKKNKFEKYGKYGKNEKYRGKYHKYPLDIEASYRCKNLYLKINVDTNNEQILKYIPNKISKRNMEFKLIITKFIDGFIKCTESKIYKSSNIILQNIETDISYNITIHAYNTVVPSLWLYASISFYLTKFHLENFKLKTPCHFTLAQNTDFLNSITNNDNEKKIVPLKNEKNITQKIIFHNINEKKKMKNNELTNNCTNMLKDIEEHDNQHFYKNNSTCSDEDNSDESIVPIKNLHIQNNLEFKGIKNQKNGNINISTRNNVTLNNNINNLNNKYNNTIDGKTEMNSQIHNTIHEDEEIKSTSSYEELLLSFHDLNKSEIRNKFTQVKYENCNNVDERKITPTFETPSGIEYPSFCKYDYNSTSNQKIEVINKVCMEEVKDKKKENYIVYKKRKDNKELKNTTILNHNPRNLNKQSFKFSEFSLKKKNVNLNTKTQKNINIKNDNNNNNNNNENNDINDIDISNMSSNELTIKEITDSNSFILSSSCLSKENFKNDNKKKNIELIKSNKDDSTENSHQCEEKNINNIQEGKQTLRDILLNQLKEKNGTYDDDDKGYIQKKIHKNDNINVNCNINKYDIDKNKNISINNNTINNNTINNNTVNNKYIKKEHNSFINYKNNEMKNIKLDKKKKGDESIKNYEKNLQDIYIKNNNYCNNYMKKSKEETDENCPVKKILPSKDNTSKLDTNVHNNMCDNIYNMLNKKDDGKENKRDSIPDYVSMADSIFHLDDCKDTQSNNSHIQELQDECVEKIDMIDKNDIYYSSSTNKKNDEIKNRNDYFKNHNICNRGVQNGNKNLCVNNKANEFNNLHKKENNILNKDTSAINSIGNNLYKNNRSVKNINDIIIKRSHTPEIVTKVLKIEETINDNTLNVVHKKETHHKQNKGTDYISNEFKENKKEGKSNSLKRYLNKTCDNLNVTSRINMLNKTSPTISFLNKTSMNNKNVDKEDNYKKCSDTIKGKSYNSEDLLYKGNFYKNVRRAYKIENKQPFDNKKKDKKGFKVDDNNINKNRALIYDNNNNNVYTHNVNSKNYINIPTTSLNTSYGNINSINIDEENAKYYNSNNKQNIMNDSKYDKQNLQYINSNKNKNTLQFDGNYIKNGSINQSEENYIIKKKKQPNYIGTDNGENNINNITSTIKNVNNYLDKLKNVKHNNNNNNNNNNIKNIYSGNTILNNNPYNYMINNNKLNYMQNRNPINIINNNDNSYCYVNNNTMSSNNNNISYIYQQYNNPIKKEDNVYNTNSNKHIPYMLNRANPFIQPNYSNKKNIRNDDYFVQSAQPHINTYTNNNEESFANLNNNVYNKFNMGTCQEENIAYNNLCRDQNKMYLLNQYNMRYNQNINQTHNELSNETKNNINNFIEENNIDKEKNIFYNKQNVRSNNDLNKKVSTPLSDVPKMIGEDNSYVIYKMNDEKNKKNYFHNNIRNINNHIMKNVDNNIHKNQYIYKPHVNPKYITPQISNINMKNNLNHMVKRINHIYPKNQNTHINNIHINNNINNINNIKNVNYLNEETERKKFIQMNKEYLKNIPMDKNKNKIYYPYTNVTDMGQHYEKQINASKLIKTVINKDSKNNVEHKEYQLPLSYYNVTQNDTSNENNLRCLNINQIKQNNHSSYDENNIMYYTSQKENYIKQNYNNFQHINDMKSININEKPINVYANNNLLYKKKIEKENEIKKSSNINIEENNILDDTNNISHMNNNVFLKSENCINNNIRKFSPSFGNINNEDIKNNNYKKEEKLQIYTNSQTFQLNIQLDEYTCKEIAFTYRDVLDEKVIAFINNNKLKKTFLNPIKEKMKYMMQNGIVKWYISITEFL